MAWLLVWIGVLVVAATGVVVSANSLRFAREIRHEARALWAQSSSETTPVEIADLPHPVRRYAETAVGRRAPVRAARLRQTGSFRTSLDGNWLPIRAEQYFTADPPGFVWWGRVRIAPGVLDEMAWLPTALFDQRRVTSVTFEIGDDGLPLRVSADRYFDAGDGKAILRPWSADFADYREVDGLLVPHLNSAYWHVSRERIPYARLQLEDVEYDVTRSF